MKRKYYTSTEVAEILFYTEEYVRKLANMGKLIAIRPTGNRLLFPVEQFENFKPIKKSHKSQKNQQHGQY
jgi:excisionase family DNA binding protein